MMPVLILDKSLDDLFNSSSIATNIVGTPYNAVHFSLTRKSNVSLASKDSPGKIIAAPLLTAPKTPITIPKQ